MYCLCSIESATRQVLLCDKKIVIHVQNFIISRIHQKYIFFLTENWNNVCLLESRRVDLCQLLEHRRQGDKAGPQGWPCQGEATSTISSLCSPQWSPNPPPVELSVHYIDLFQNLRRRPRSARSPLSSSKSGIVASLWEQNSELEAQKLLVLDVVLDKDHVSMCKNISLHWQTWSNQVQ